MDAARNLASDPAYVQVMYEEMLEHQREWSADRAAALAIRRSLEQADISGIYQCDDKCGSFWQALPVDPTGMPMCKLAIASTICVNFLDN